MARRDSSYPDMGVSDATLKRGYSTLRDPDVPSKTKTYRFGDGESVTAPNPERMTYDADEGRMVDAYAGGFLRRTPHCPEDR